MIGGGGLGELAINYGYQQFNVAVMLETVIILILLVQIVQMVGDHLAKTKRLTKIGMMTIVFCVIVFLTQLWPSANPSNRNTLKVGVMSGWPQTVMQVAKIVAEKKYGLYLQIIPFTDYVQPNIALANHSIDANIFQHAPYLTAQMQIHHYPFIVIGKTFVYPMGFYSKKYHDLTELPDHALIAIPNDPSNEARSLLLLQQAGLIRLKQGASTLATVHDIVQNDKALQFTLLDAAQLPRALNDVAMAAITNDYIGPAGLSISDAIIKENSQSPYANVIVARTDSEKQDALKKLAIIMHSPDVVAATDKLFPNGAAIRAW